MGQWPGLGDRIRQKIRELGHENAAQFADAKGYRVTYVYKWISGTLPSRDNLLRLAKDLRVSPAWLLFGDEQVEKRRKPAPIRGGSGASVPLPGDTPERHNPPSPWLDGRGNTLDPRSYTMPLIGRLLRLGWYAYLRTLLVGHENPFTDCPVAA